MKFLTLMAAAVTICSASSTLAAERADLFAAKSFEKEYTQKLGYKYLITLPEGYDERSAEKFPLVVFLHGAGERGNDMELLKKHGPPKLIAAGKKLPAIVACPQVPAGEAWNEHGVKALVDELKKHYLVDESRVYLTGISMGGFGTWATILEYPDVFAAAAPICGGAGIGMLKFNRISKLPIWMFHGDADSVVPVEFTTIAANRLKNDHVKMTIYPGVGHDSWTQTYDNQEFWDWLFAQRKS